MRIENVKLDFKDKAHAKVGSLDNATHTPGGGNIVVKNKKKSLLTLRSNIGVFSLNFNIGFPP